MVQPNYQFRALDARTRRKRRRCATRSRARCCGASTIAAGHGDGRVLVDFTEFLVRDGNDMAGRLRPGSYRFDATRSSIYLPMTLRLPEEHRDGSRADVRAPGRRGAAGGRGGGGGGGGGASSKASAASRRPPKRRASASTTRSSSCRTRTTSRAPTIRARASARCRSRTTRRCPGQPMTQRFIAPAPAAEEGSDGRGQRAGEADRLLPRSRRARADPLGAARRRALVEPGVRGRRLSQRVPASSCCPRASSPLDIRYNVINWVHRSTRGWSTGAQRHRSAHRRDHQGRRHARLAAHPPGLHDRRGPAAARTRTATETPQELTRVGRWRASASSRRTRSATRSASATTTTTARPAGSR